MRNRQTRGNMNRVALFVLFVSGFYSITADGLSRQEVKQKLLSTKPELHILDIRNSPLEGFYQISLPGGNVLYVTEDGKHFIAGDLYRVANSGLLNLTEIERNHHRKELIDQVDEGEMLVFAPENEKASVTVFTDVDCGYCRKLHKEVPELNRMGIAIRYLAYPRAGIQSSTYKKMVSAWCADDPQAALTKAKLGEEIPPRDCDNPVAKHFVLGNELGVTGTPALILANGRLIAGYLSAKDLAALLDVN